MILYWITDRRGVAGDLAAAVERALRAGVDWVQIREKDLGGRKAFELARELGSKRGGGIHRIVWNGRADVALAARLDGVHLPSDAPSPAAIRRAAPEGFRIGVSCHTADEARRAADEGADFAVYGPVFETASKPGYGPIKGLAGLRATCRVAGIPVLALGGVGVENAAACLEAGAAGLAGISMFQGAEPVEETVARLRAEASGR